MEEAVLRQIASQIGDLVALYRLVNKDRIVRARNEALGDGNKRKLWDACDGSRNQGELSEVVGVSKQRVSQIIADLAESGMVAKSEEGNWVRRLE